MRLRFWHWFKTPAFRPKLVYFYVIEVADSGSDLGLFITALAPLYSKIGGGGEIGKKSDS